MPTQLERALIATRESRRVEFKESFALDEETTRDAAAIANSGGGVILFGVNRSGQPTGAELPSVAEAAARRRDWEFGETVKFGRRVLTAVVPEAPAPVVIDGVVYVRRGARSVPATSEELAKIVQRLVEAARKEWLGAVRRVVKQEPPPSPVAVRIVEDRRAPAYRVVDYDRTHPYRQKELLAAFRARVPEHPINQFDFLAVRTVHKTDDRPEYTHKPMFGSRQYSESFLDWLVAQARRDPAFFEDARRRYRSY